MTHQAPPSPASAGPDPGRQVAQLREALRLVERIAGRAGAARSRRSTRPRASPAPMTSPCRSCSAASRRSPQETAFWAAAGVEALLAAGEADPPRAAAARLARRLDAALSEMAALLR